MNSISKEREYARTLLSNPEKYVAWTHQFKGHNPADPANPTNKRHFVRAPMKDALPVFQYHFLQHPNTTALPPDDIIVAHFIACHNLHVDCWYISPNDPE